MDEPIIGAGSDNGGAEPQSIQLLIELGKKGELNVSGPGDGKLFDEPLCLWMLDKAKDFIKYRNAQVMQQQQIVVPPPRIRDIFNRGRK